MNNPSLSPAGVHSDSAAGNDAQLIEQLRSIVGRSHVLTDSESTRRYRTGFRFGSGTVLAVVRPASLVEQWKLLQACAASGKIVIMQSANTGLTGGSTPDGDDYDRGIVIMNTIACDGPAFDRWRPPGRLPAGNDIVRPGKGIAAARPGAAFGDRLVLYRRLRLWRHLQQFRRRADPSRPGVYQLSLFARIDEAGKVELINHLGIRLGNEPEAILEALGLGNFTDADIEHDTTRFASDHGYAHHVRDVNADTPARFNADPQRLYEASGSAGKVMLLAVRLDTFPKEEKTAVFYIGTNNTSELTEIRRHILSAFEGLPISGEYMHREAFDIAETYGKDTFLAIQYLGTDRLPQLFAVKGWFDGLAGRFGFLPSHLSDRIMQAASQLFPSQLPKRMKEYRDRFEHHLILKMSGAGIAEARDYLASIFPSTEGDFFECTPEEGDKAFLHRFAAAGAAIRYRAVHGREVEDIVALDIALRRDERNWFETLPADVEAPILHKLYYGHFFCHVFHQDYIVAKGHDTLELEHKMWALLDQRGAEYPAEHNVGHLYQAKPALVAHYRKLDPCNCFNPGIGRTSKLVCWGS